MLLQRVKFSSFLWLRRIPLCKCPTAVFHCVNVTQLLMGTWATVNNSAMNIGVLTFF